jgi:hypothetical protein
VYDVVDTYEESCAMTDEVDDDFGVARDLSPDPYFSANDHGRHDQVLR